MARVAIDRLGLTSLVAGLALLVGPAASAQEAGEAVTVEEAVEDAALLDEATLDALVAPVALYPDALLTQVLVAATYPLDVVKAQRLVEDSAGLPDAERAALAQEQPWDPSVQVLAGGFPTVVDRMAEEIDWTEQLGDAMLLQTDDLLDAVQRMRARAVATGYLDSNEAQTVAVEEATETIAIAPADPEVVYVPSYDPAMAFTSAPTAAPVFYGQDEGWSTTDVLTTGAIAFGGAMILNEIFEDDDDDWDDYWRGPSIDWDDAEIYARPDRDIDIGGDVNIGRLPDRDFDRNRPNRARPDRDRPDRDRPDRDIAVERNNSVEIDRNELTVERDQPNLNRPDRPDRPGDGDSVRPDRPNRPGDGEGGALANRPGDPGNGDDGALANRPGTPERPDRPGRARPDNDLVATRPGASPDGAMEDGAWRPQKEQRDAARDRVAARDPSGGGTRDKARESLKARDADPARDEARKKLAARGGAAEAVVPGVTARPAKMPKETALKPKAKGSKDVKKAVNRGARSAEKAKLPAATSRAAAKAKSPGAVRVKAEARPKGVSQPKVKKSAVKRSPPKASAFKKPSKSHRVSAASSRGHKSGGKLKKRR